MIELGSRARPLPAPPRVVFGSLVSPQAPGARPWLALRSGEVAPVVLESVEPTWVVWSTLWTDRPDERIELALSAKDSGTLLRWTLLTPGERPGDAVVGRMRYRLNHLLWADLRFSYGQ